MFLNGFTFVTDTDLIGLQGPDSLAHVMHAGIIFCKFMGKNQPFLFHLTTSYSSYFRGKEGISRNKTSIFLLMALQDVDGNSANMLHLQVMFTSYRLIC